MSNTKNWPVASDDIISTLPNRKKIKSNIYDFIKWYHETIAFNELAPLINHHLLIEYYKDMTGKKISYTSLKRYIDEFEYFNDGRLITKDGYELLPDGHLVKSSNPDEVNDLMKLFKEIRESRNDEYKHYTIAD